MAALIQERKLYFGRIVCRMTAIVTYRNEPAHVPIERATGMRCGKGRKGELKKTKNRGGCGGCQLCLLASLRSQVLAERVWFLVSVSWTGLGLVRLGGGAVTGTLLWCYKSL